MVYHLGSKKHVFVDWDLIEPGSGLARYDGRVREDAASPTLLATHEMPHGVRITDRINGGSCEQARLSFLLHPEVKVIQGENVLLLERGAARIVMASDWEPEVNPAVWWPDMGHEIPTQRIVVALPPGVSVTTTSFQIVSQGRETG